MNTNNLKDMCSKVNSLLVAVQADTPIPVLLRNCSDHFKDSLGKMHIALTEYDLNNKIIHSYFCELGDKVTVAIIESNSSKLLNYKHCLSEPFAKGLQDNDDTTSLAKEFIAAEHHDKELISYPIVDKSNENNGNIFFIRPKDTELSADQKMVVDFLARILSVAVIKQLTSIKFEDEHVKLVSAGKKAALGEMAGGIAHEINNPLAVISGQAQKIKLLQGMGKLEPEEITKSIEKILSTVDRINHIITALRAFSRDDTKVKKQNQNLITILDDSLALCAEKIKGRGVEIHVDNKVEEAIVFCNPVQLSQVIINLISNSFDAVFKLDNPWIRLQVEMADKKVVFKITDSGDGIDKDIRDQIMEPFFTTKEVGHGTGIGLSLSQGIIRTHGGSFYYNEESPNTEFIIVLPQSEIKDKESAA